jgi:hypothetical protein
MSSEKDRFMNGETVTFTTTESIVLEDGGSVHIKQGHARSKQEQLNLGTHNFSPETTIVIFQNSTAQLSKTKV